MHFFQLVELDGFVSMFQSAFMYGSNPRWRNSSKLLVFCPQIIQIYYMRKQLVWFVAVVLALIAGFACVFAIRRGSEPVYQGRRLSAWLVDAAEINDLDAQMKAEVAIRAIGTNAMPYLIKMMRAHDSPLKLKIGKLLAKQNMFRAGFEPASDVQCRAANACSILQTQAKLAIPSLQALLPEEESGLLAAHALVSVGPDGVMAAVANLTNHDENVRINIALALAKIGMKRSSRRETTEEIAVLNQEANIAVRPLLNLLTNKTDPARAQAATTLGALGVQSSNVVPALVAMLQSSDNSLDGVSVAMASARALGRFGPEAEAAVPALVAALKSPSPGLRGAASDALKKIDPQAAINAGIQ
jgi:HEAT repeat protein